MNKKTIQININDQVINIGLLTLTVYALLYHTVAVCIALYILLGKYVRNVQIRSADESYQNYTSCRIFTFLIPWLILPIACVMSNSIRETVKNDLMVFINNKYYTLIFHSQKEVKNEMAAPKYSGINDSDLSLRPF